MADLSLERSRFAQTAMVSAVTLAAWALFSLVLAYWTWAWLGPGPAPQVPAATEPEAQLASAFNLFGNTARRGNAAPPTGLAMRLLGVAAASAARQGYAVVQLEPHEVVVVREGENVALGIRLAEVRPDRIILERNGVRETLALPEKKSLPAQETNLSGARNR